MVKNFGTKSLATLQLDIQHRVLEYYQCFHMMILGDLDHFYDRVKFVSECLCMDESSYSIECSCISMFCTNSAYPQHSCERYRTNGTLVIYFNKLDLNFISSACLGLTEYILWESDYKINIY